MIVHRHSLTFRIIMFLNNPTYWLPPLFPLWTEHARVGDNTTDYLRVTFRKPV